MKKIAALRLRALNQTNPIDDTICPTCENCPVDALKREIDKYNPLEDSAVMKHARNILQKHEPCWKRR